MKERCEGKAKLGAKRKDESVGRGKKEEKGTSRVRRVSVKTRHRRGMSGGGVRGIS